MVIDPLDLKTEMAILESRLEWPDKALLSQYYLKLLQHPGSVIVMALEAPRGPAGPQWKSAWLSARERSAMRKAVEKINVARRKKNEPTTDQSPE